MPLRHRYLNLIPTKETSRVCLYNSYIPRSFEITTFGNAYWAHLNLGVYTLEKTVFLCFSPLRLLLTNLLANNIVAYEASNIVSMSVSS